MAMFDLSIELEGPELKDAAITKIVKNVEESDGTYVEAGFFGPKANRVHPFTTPPHGRSGWTVVQLAIVHGFGHGKVPKRDFMQAAVDKNVSKWSKKLADAMETIAYEGKTPARPKLKKLGQRMAKDIQRAIEDLDTPPLADETIAWRQKWKFLPPDDPLMASRTMHDTVDSRFKIGKKRA